MIDGKQQMFYIKTQYLTNNFELLTPEHKNQLNLDDSKKNDDLRQITTSEKSDVVDVVKAADPSKDDSSMKPDCEKWYRLGPYVGTCL